MPPTDNKKPEVSHADLMARFDERFDELSGLIRSGFPEGDPITHRKVHESYMQEAKDRHEFRQKIKAGFAQSLIWLLFITVITALGKYLGVGPIG